MVSSFLYFMIWIINLVILVIIFNALFLLIQLRPLDALKYFILETVFLIAWCSMATVFFFGRSPKDFGCFYSEYTCKKTISSLNSISVNQSIKKPFIWLITKGTGSVASIVGCKGFENTTGEGKTNDVVFFKTIKESFTNSYEVSIYSTSGRQMSKTDIFQKPIDLFFIVKPGIISETPIDLSVYSLNAVFSEKYANAFSNFGGSNSISYSADEIADAIISFISPDSPILQTAVPLLGMSEISENAIGGSYGSSSVIHALSLEVNWQNLSSNTSDPHLKNIISFFDSKINPTQKQKLFFGRLEKQLKKINDKAGSAFTIANGALSLINQISKVWEYTTLKDCATYVLIESIRESAKKQNNSRLVEGCDKALEIIDEIYKKWLESFLYSIQTNFSGVINDFGSISIAIIEMGKNAGILTEEFANKVSIFFTVIQTTGVAWEVQFGTWAKVPLIILAIADNVMFDLKATSTKFIEDKINKEEIDNTLILSGIYFKAVAKATDMVVKRWDLFSLENISMLDLCLKFLVALNINNTGKNLQDIKKARKIAEDGLKCYPSFQTFDRSLYNYVISHTKEKGKP